jgi:aminoglycoside phosphotransferase (APT) family kinase protein
MADDEPVKPDRQLLDAVARLVGVDQVLVTDEQLHGESHSTFAVAAADGELVVKLVPGAQQALENQWRLVRLIRDLRRRGYPAPEYVGAGQSGGSVFTVQRRLPGQPLHRVRPPWPAWLLDTIETGGNGCCLHATMRQSPDTAALLRHLQTLARRNRPDEIRTRDVVHFDMNPANILHSGGRLTGVVDWNIPLDGAGQGDRGFDVATLLSSTPTTLSRRRKHCGNAHCSSAAWRGPPYICAISACDRRNGRGGTALAPLTTIDSWPLPKPCCTTVRRKARDGGAAVRSGVSHGRTRGGS